MIKEKNFHSMLSIRPGITAIIGSGGKTSLMMRLAAELADRYRVIVTTSTHINKPAGMPVLSGADRQEIADAFKATSMICVAGSIGESAAEENAEDSCKLGMPGCSFAELSELADYVLVEADGSRGLPIKAHAVHEPVIPEDCDQVICVVGADGFGHPVREVCHRYELFCGMSGLLPDEQLSPEAVAGVIAAEGFADKVYINKAESEAAMEDAALFAADISLPVFAGSLNRGEIRCL